METNPLGSKNKGAWITPFERASKLFEFGRMDEAMLESKTARRLAREEGDIVGEALSITQIARCEIALGKLEDAGRDLDEAYQKAQKSGVGGVIANFQDARGIYYRDIGLVDEAIAEFKNALEICNCNCLLDGIGNTSANLARTYLYRNSSNGNYVLEAEDKLKTAANKLKGLPGDGNIRLWQMLTLVYIQKGELEKALDSLEYSLKLKDYYFKQKRSIPPLDINDLGRGQETVSELLSKFNNLQYEFKAAMGSQDLHAKISAHFFKAKAHILLAERILKEHWQIPGNISDPLKIPGDCIGHRLLAFELYRNGIDILESDLRAGLSRSESRITFFQYRVEAYEQMVLLCRELSRFDDAFNYAEKSKSRGFLDQLATRSAENRTVLTQELVGYPLEFMEVKKCLK